MKCVTLAMTFFAWMVLGTPFYLSHADEENRPPYLYYYSGILNAFVIERADGTDSRTLARDVIPKNHNEIHQPVWSPSGRWLAWRSAENGGLGPSWYSGWIISSDGTRRLTLLDHPTDVLVHTDVMEWAAGDDLLFVSEVVVDENRENAIQRFMLIDADSETIIASSTFEANFPEDPISFSWLPDAQGVAVFRQSQMLDQLERVYSLHLTLLLTDGTTRSETYAAKTALSLSPDGRLAYITADEEHLVIQNLFEGSTQEYALAHHADDSYENDLVWNPKQNVAIYYVPHAEHSELRLLDFNVEDNLLLKSDVQRLTDGRPQVGHRPVSPGLWSPDGERFLFLTADGSHWVLELADRSLSLLENMPDYETISWAEHSQQLLLENDTGTVVYDLLSQQSTLVTQIIKPAADVTEVNLSFPSPNGQHVGLSVNEILRIESGTTRHFSIHSAATYATPFIHDYNWHSEGSWVIITTNVTFSGCCGPNAYLVLQGDAVDNDDHRRELTVRWGNSAGWVPQRAINHLAVGHLESVLQQPDQTYRFDDRVTGLAWSPDGRSIAVVTHRGAVFMRDIASPVASLPVFNLNSPCGPDGFYPPCPVYWENDVIFIGNQAWDTVERTAFMAANEDRVECYITDCITALSDVISPDGRWLARPNERRRVDVIDQQSGEIIGTFALENRDVIASMEWVNDKLVMHFAPEIIIFSPETRETRVLESVRSTGYADRFYTVSVSPDGRFVAGGSIVTETHLWEIETGKLVTVLNWYAQDLAFSPDGRWLALGNTDLVTLWDLSVFVEPDH